ncbi:MAG: LysR family transcriptional regulator [Pseudomonadota bacterium]
MDWSDLRIFLALARGGSVRSAGKVLTMSHSTIARRIDGFEGRLGVRLFDRQPTGFALTAAGEELLETAERVEEDISGAERRLVGKDAKLRGEIKVTMPDALGTHLLMPDLAAFSTRYPEIELEVILSYDQLDLSQREADVALRFARPSQGPPDSLVGRRVLRVAQCAYASPDYLERHDLRSAASGACWIGWSDQGPYPEWVRQSAFPNIPVRGRLHNVLIQIEGTKQGMGLGMLPCFIGDCEDELVRVPGATPELLFDLWVLSHEDLRSTARMRAFRDFICAAIVRQKELLEGRRPRQSEDRAVASRMAG